MDLSILCLLLKYIAYILCTQTLELQYKLNRYLYIC